MAFVSTMVDGNVRFSLRNGRMTFFHDLHLPYGQKERCFCIDGWFLPKGKKPFRKDDVVGLGEKPT